MYPLWTRCWQSVENDNEKGGENKRNISQKRRWRMLSCYRRHLETRGWYRCRTAATPAVNELLTPSLLHVYQYTTSFPLVSRSLLSLSTVEGRRGCRTSERARARVACSLQYIRLKLSLHISPTHPFLDGLFTTVQVVLSVLISLRYQKKRGKCLF